MSPDSTVIILAAFSVTFVVLGLFTFSVLMMIRNHKKVVAAQRERIRQMQLFSEKLQSAREEEQKRIARELHDELGGTLTSIKYDLLWLEQRTSVQGEVAQRFQIMRDLIDSTTKVVQRISAELRPKILDSFGLAVALEWQTNEFKKRTGVDANFQKLSELPPIDENVTTGVYRIVQESLTNIARHAQATSVEVKLELQNDMIHVEIIDNGKGFDKALLQHPDSLGLLSIRERARMIGGTAVIDGSPGKGTKVALDTPLHYKSFSQAKDDLT
ncbi:MAG: sensor histidine kinase [Bacteroidetes bacterium]|nr:sensor histidine kinase [Bacteroidota bacterium]